MPATTVPRMSNVIRVQLIYAECSFLIPNRLILEFRVLVGTPKSSVAPPTPPILPLTCFNIFRIYSFSFSSMVLITISFDFNDSFSLETTICSAKREGKNLHVRIEKLDLKLFISDGSGCRINW